MHVSSAGPVSSARQLRTAGHLRTARPPIPWRTRLLHRASRLAGSVADLTPAQLDGLRVTMPRSRVVDLVTGGSVAGVDIDDALVPVRDGRSVRVRRYRLGGVGLASGDAAPVLVFLHGGGWVLGRVENYDPLCSHLSAGVGALVVSVEYRLAPEHPAPAAIHDCLDVVRALPALAPAWGGDPDRLAIAGDSAGGNLAAVVTQLLRDEGGPRLRAQALVYPSVDSTCLSRSKIEFAEGPILTRRDTDAYFALYLGTGPDALTPLDPLISPALGELHDLPPALVQTAGLDPLRDEGAAYAVALRAAGVPAVHTDYPFAPHGFASWPGLSVGVASHRAELVAFLRRHLVAGGVEDSTTTGGDAKSAAAQ